MNLDIDDTEVLNPVSIGRREVINGKIIKVRPLTFSVKKFESKRNILKANSFLCTSKDEIFNKMYFTLDLTKNQHEEVFKLREQKRYRTDALKEKHLKISRSKIVVSVPEEDSWN